MQRQILVVEDSSVQARVLKNLLAAAGYDVRVAENGRVGLALAQEHRPTLIISDIDMPEMNGYELCRAIKSSPDLSSIPVILLTMLADAQDIIAGLRAGADNYVTKPYDGAFLLSRIESLLATPVAAPAEQGGDLEVVVAGIRHSIAAGRSQLLNLLISTFENAVKKNEELVEAVQNLTRLQRQMEQKNKALEAANNDKNRVLGMAAHDLRNPIGASLNYTQFLQDGLKGRIEDRHRRCLDSIERTNRYMLKLVEQLLDLSAIESGKVSLNLSETDVVELVRTVLEIDTILAARKSIDIVLNVQGEGRAVVDAAKVEQIIHNLVSNAVKFSEPSTVVTVNLGVTHQDVELTVSDQGRGIPESEQHKLFQAFEVTSVQATGDERCTGLGLAIVRHLVEAHGGAIGVESKVGVGTTFRVRMPVRVAAVT